MVAGALPPLGCGQTAEGRVSGLDAQVAHCRRQRGAEPSPARVTCASKWEFTQRRVGSRPPMKFTRRTRQCSDGSSYLSDFWLRANLIGSPDGKKSSPGRNRSNRIAVFGAAVSGLLAKLFRGFQKLGPGIVTGAADDDPSGIATYSQVGAQFGFTMLWTMLLTYPLMAGIQEISAWIGRVTGVGIAGNVRRHYSPLILYPLVVLLLIANVINLGVCPRNSQLMLEE
jgi:Natural resistance-associated macrophage protein